RRPWAIGRRSARPRRSKGPCAPIPARACCATRWKRKRKRKRSSARRKRRKPRPCRPTWRWASKKRRSRRWPPKRTPKSQPSHSPEGTPGECLRRRARSQRREPGEVATAACPALLGRRGGLLQLVERRSRSIGRANAALRGASLVHGRRRESGGGTHPDGFRNG